MRIALLDDEDDLLDALSSLIRLRGFDVTCFLRPEDFESANSHGPFDVLVTDFGLGRASGFDVARQFLAASPNSKAFIFTGSLDDLPEERGVTVLRKPTGIEKLFEALDGLARAA